ILTLRARFRRLIVQICFEFLSMDEGFTSFLQSCILRRRSYNESRHQKEDWQTGLTKPRLSTSAVHRLKNRQPRVRRPYGRFVCLPAFGFPAKLPVRPLQPRQTFFRSSLELCERIPESPLSAERDPAFPPDPHRRCTPPAKDPDCH